MTRLLVVSGAIGLAVLSNGSSANAQRNQPGFPTLAEVQILNRAREDSIPVKIQNIGDSLPVILVNEPAVTFGPAAVVGARTVRQVWEYRRLAVPSSQDATSALNQAGAEGWEAVSSLVFGTDAVWTLKRPK